MTKVACIRYNLEKKQPYKPMNIPIPEEIDTTDRDLVDDYCSDFLQERFVDYNRFYVKTILNV